MDDDENDNARHELLLSQELQELEDALQVTWGEVFRVCCIHTPREWGVIALGIVMILALLYLFLFSLTLLSSSAKVISGCHASELVGSNTNPITGLMIGLISTALIHSSSTVTSIVVSITPSVLSVEQAIYIMMGSNIGTTITNTMVSLTQMGDADQLERAFTGATVHDIFNVYSVLLFFPIEWATGFLKHLTAWMTKNANLNGEQRWNGPAAAFVAPLSNRIIESNEQMLNDIAANSTIYNCNSGEMFYPTECNDPSNPTASTCSKQGLISCNADTGNCPAFFQVGAVAHDDKVSGGAVFFIAVSLLFTSFVLLLIALQRILIGVSTRVIYKATEVNGYVAICIGCGITMVIQSSTVFTSVLTPLVGLDILRLEQMYALTLGANLGTCVTALLASTVSDSVESLQVALSHFMFNFLGILVFYPVPFMRELVLETSRRIGKCTRIWRGFPILFIAIMFGFLPFLFIGISTFFTSGEKGYTVIGSFIVAMFGLGLVYGFVQCQFRGGKERCRDCMAQRERKRRAFKSLPDDLEHLKTKADEVEYLRTVVLALVEYTGLPEGYCEESDSDTGKSTTAEG
jgi:solute carrier family 34 (sodium-dependent phosphate cotransporter)